mgnify:CR=1 FL=1
MKLNYKNRYQKLQEVNKFFWLPQGLKDYASQKFEEVYSKTRILEKPNSYILDQDHHNHPANQSKNFDWQFFSEIYSFLPRSIAVFVRFACCQLGQSPI